MKTPIHNKILQFQYAVNQLIFEIFKATKIESILLWLTDKLKRIK